MVDSFELKTVFHLNEYFSKDNYESEKLHHFYIEFLLILSFCFFYFLNFNPNFFKGRFSKED